MQRPVSPRKERDRARQRQQLPAELGGGWSWLAGAAAPHRRVLAVLAAVTAALTVGHLLLGSRGAPLKLKSAAAAAELNSAAAHLAHWLVPKGANSDEAIADTEVAAVNSSDSGSALGSGWESIGPWGAFQPALAGC